MPSLPTRSLSALPPGVAIGRFLTALVKSDGDIAAATQLADSRYGSTPHVHATLKHFLTKAAVPAGSTTDSPWAGALAQFGMATEAWTLLQSRSIFGRLAPTMRRVAWRTPIPRELESGAAPAATWIAEGAPAPVQVLRFDASLRLDFRRIQRIAALTRELFQFSTIAEAAITQAVVGGLTRVLDDQLLNPSVPGSLTAQGTVIASTGTTPSQVVGDLEALIAAIQTPGESLVWVMRRRTLSRLAARLATVGVTVTPTTLLGLPVIASSTCPPIIGLIDGDSVAYASDDAVDLDVSSGATLQMTDTPTAAPTAHVSLFQSNLVAVKAGVAANWTPIAFTTGSPALAAGVSYMMTPMAFDADAARLLPSDPPVVRPPLDEDDPPPSRRGRR